jgi:hypothetical protein
MSQTIEREIVKIDAVLESLQQERRRCTDPADILRVSESIDLRLDERLRHMRRRNGDRTSSGRGRCRSDSS